MSIPHMLTAAKDSPVVAVAAPTITAGLSLLNVQSVLVTVSMVVGLIVSLILLGNHLIKRRILLEELKVAIEDSKMVTNNAPAPKRAKNPNAKPPNIDLL
jgi:hypothetical protein